MTKAMHPVLSRELSYSLAQRLTTTKIIFRGFDGDVVKMFKTALGGGGWGGGWLSQLLPLFGIFKLFFLVFRLWILIL
jgi:hypothetical protein